MTASLAPHLEKLLAQLPDKDRLDFAQLIDALYAIRFTGITPIHWRNGVPQQIEIGAPIRLMIVSGLDKPNGNGGS